MCRILCSIIYVDTINEKYSKTYTEAFIIFVGTKIAMCYNYKSDKSL